MTITVNGQPLQVDPRETVAALLARLNLAGGPCAVEVNKALVPKSQHSQRQLAEGDMIEVVTLVGGG